MLKLFLILILVVVLVLFALVRYLEGSSVFFPGHNMDNLPSHMNLKYEDIYFKTSDGVTINGWLVKNAQATSTLIFAHGNAGNMSDRVLKVKFFHDLGLNVFIFDYRGFGNSQGRPTEKGIYLDAQAAYDYLKARPDLDAHRFIAYGASLGGVAMIDLATRRELAALVVDSSFTSAADMAQRIYPYLPTFMMSIRFDSVQKVKKLNIPKLFIHSPDDRTVPFTLGVKLYEAAAGPKEFLKAQGGHNDVILASDPQVARAFVKFLRNKGLL